LVSLMGSIFGSCFLLWVRVSPVTATLIPSMCLCSRSSALLMVSLTLQPCTFSVCYSLRLTALFFRFSLFLQTATSPPQVQCTSSSAPVKLLGSGSLTMSLTILSTLKANRAPDIIWSDQGPQFTSKLELVL
jgi:hypothetical protein